MRLFQSASSSCSVISKNQLLMLLLRGIVGIGLLSYAFSLLSHSPMWGWALLAAAIFLLRGCPACWGMHLVNAMRKTQKPSGIPPTSEDERQRPRRKKYVPKDMAEHLFPPEDVNRFRQRSEP